MSEVEQGPKMAKKAVGVTASAELVVVVDHNPKREGKSAWERFNGYLTNPRPATVQEALDNGLTMGDIKYDLIHGYIEVDGASVEEYEVTARGPRVSDEDGDPAASDDDSDF